MQVQITIDLQFEKKMRKIFSNTTLQESLQIIGEELCKEKIESQVVFHLPTGNVVYNPIQISYIEME